MVSFYVERKGGSVSLDLYHSLQQVTLFLVSGKCMKGHIQVIGDGRLLNYILSSFWGRVDLNGEVDSLP